MLVNIDFSYRIETHRFALNLPLQVIGNEFFIGWMKSEARSDRFHHRPSIIIISHEVTTHTNEEWWYSSSVTVPCSARKLGEQEKNENGTL